jgi:hypothetical protein
MLELIVISIMQKCYAACVSHCNCYSKTISKSFDQTKTTNSVTFSPQANYADRSATACRRR